MSSASKDANITNVNNQNKTNCDFADLTLVSKKSSTYESSLGLDNFIKHLILNLHCLPVITVFKTNICGYLVQITKLSFTFITLRKFRQFFLFMGKGMIQIIICKKK